MNWVEALGLRVSRAWVQSFSRSLSLSLSLPSLLLLLLTHSLSLSLSVSLSLSSPCPLASHPHRSLRAKTKVMAAISQDIHDKQNMSSGTLARSKFSPRGEKGEVIREVTIRDFEGLAEGLFAG